MIKSLSTFLFAKTNNLHIGKKTAFIDKQKINLGEVGIVHSRCSYTCFVLKKINHSLTTRCCLQDKISAIFGLGDMINCRKYFLSDYDPFLLL